jgi:hypothetical protein
MTSFFVILAERNISIDLFNSMLSIQELSLLICSCKTMKKTILEWKSIFPIEHLIMKSYMNDEKLEKMILYYSNNVHKLSWDYILPKGLTLLGYQMLSQLQSYLTDFKIINCIQNGLPIISGSLNGLIILKIENFNSGAALQTSDDLCSISRLTNLENLSFESIFNLDDTVIHKYSTLSKLISISIYKCKNFTGVGLSTLVETFRNLKALTLISKFNDIGGISTSEDYFCLTTLTNLNSLKVRGKFDNIGLRLVCCNCLNITSLNIDIVGYFESPQLITVGGLNCIHSLTNLRELYVDVPHKNDYHAFYNKLSQFTNIEKLKIEYPIDLSEETSGSDVEEEE